MYLLLYVVSGTYKFADDVIVFVDTFTRRLTLKAKSSDTIGDVKEKIQNETGISSHYQQLRLAGKPLDDSYTLSHHSRLTLHLETKLSGKNLKHCIKSVCNLPRNAQ